MVAAFDAIGPSSVCQTSATTSISWTHIAGAGAGTVLVWLEVGLTSGTTLGTFTSVTYNGAPMTLLATQESGGAGSHAGGLFCYGITGAATGSVTVAATYSSATGLLTIIGSSESYTGAGSFGTPATNSAQVVTTGSVALAGTTSGGVCAVGICDGSGGETLTNPSGITQRFKNDFATTSAAGCAIGGTVASTGAGLTFTWSMNSDWYGAIAVEVLPGGSAPAGSSAVMRPPQRRMRAKRLLGGWRPNVGQPTLPVTTASITLTDVGAAADGAPSQQPYVIANITEASGSTSYVIPVTGATSAGDGITVIAGVGGTAPPAITSVTDSQGQKYRQLQQTSASPYIAAWTAPGDIALTTSDTITITFAAAATGGFGVLAIGTPGMRTIDVNTTPATGNSTSPAVSGTPAAGGEIALAAFVWANAGGTGALAAPFTQLAQSHPAGGAFTTVASLASSPAAGAALAAGATIVSGAWRAMLLTLEPTTPWYLSNATFIHQMFVQDPASASQFFNTPTAFAISNNPASTGIQDSFTCTPLLKYVSYAQLQADITASAINGAFTWLMYDNEYQDDGAGGNAWGTPMAEANDPWTAMANFVTLAHAHGYKVILAPGRDLGNNASLVNPKTGGETLDAWYIRTNIAGTGAGTGAEVMHVQAQADTLPLTSFTSFWNSTRAQIAAASATCQASVGVSTSYGSASDMAAAASAAAPTAWGYWLNATSPTIPQASDFLELMAGSNPTSPQVQDMAGSADTLSAAVSVPVSDIAGAAESATASVTTPAQDVAGVTDGLAVGAAASLADTAGAAETFTVAQSATAVALADTGAASDAVTPAASVPLSETAGVADTVTAAAALGLADTAGSADSVSGTAAVPLAEKAAAADSIAATAALPQADAAGSADAITVTVTATLVESAAAAEATPRDDIESAGAIDQISPAATVPLAETGAGAETLSATAAVPLADPAGAADAIAVVVGNVVALAEAGAATDAPAVSVAAPQADTGATTDALAATVSAPLREAAGAAEGLSVVVGNVIALADSGAGADQIAVAAAPTAADQAAGIDSMAAGASVPVSDLAGAADVISVVAGAVIVFTDAGAAIDHPAEQVSGGPGEAAGGADTLTAAASAPVADQAGTADSLTAAASVPYQDTAGAAEALSVVQGAAPALAETAGAADQLHVQVSVALAEQGAVAELLTAGVALTLTDLAGAREAVLVLTSDAISGRVTYRAQPEQPRWLALPEPRRWAAQPERARWTARPDTARWGAQPQRPRWRAMLESFEPIPAVSLEEVNIRWTSDLDGTSIDPTLVPLTVQYAFPASSGNLAAPGQPVTWYAGSWLGGGTGKGYVSQCLVGPGGGVVALTAGKYDVWGKITGSPESPARFAGVLTVF